MHEVLRLCACALVLLSTSFRSANAQACQTVFILPSGQGNGYAVPRFLNGVLVTTVQCNTGYVVSGSNPEVQTLSIPCVNGAWVGTIDCVRPTVIGVTTEFCPYAFSFIQLLPNINHCVGGCTVGVCCAFPRTSGSTCAGLVTRPRPKAGLCQYPDLATPVCVNSCSDDTACPGTQKCCQRQGTVGCLNSPKTCSLPVNSGCQLNANACSSGFTCTILMDRVAECINNRCPAPSSGSCPLGNVDACVLDSGCPQNSACCWDGCRKVCTGVTALSCTGYTGCTPPAVCQIIANTRICTARATCPVISIPNAHISSTGVTVDTTVLITCSTGYQLIGSARTTCTPSGAISAWNPPLPTCRGTNCAPLSIPNGRTNNQLTYDGVSVSIICNLGYTTGITFTVHCRGGRWTQVPVCRPVLTCPELRIPNAVGLSTDRRIGSIVEVRCAEGYRVHDPRTNRIECRQLNADTARWTGIPVCVGISCPRLGPPENGILSSGLADDNRIFTVKTFACNEGYQASGSSRRLCEPTGRWSGQPTVCTPFRCPRPTAQPRGTVTIQGDGRIGSVAIYTCDRGYQMGQGLGQGFCGSDGLYSPPPPTCNRIVVCNPVGTPNNGWKIPRDNNVVQVNSRVRFNCNPGFLIRGPTEIICQANGAYDNAPPICSPATCSDPPTIQFGQRTVSNGNQVGSQAQYTCTAGYSLSANAVMICTDQGNNQAPRWAGQLPQCLIRDCGQLPNLANAATWPFGLSTAIGASHFVHCVTNHMPDRITATCTRAGRWDYSSGCTAIQCPPVLRPNNGRLSSTNFLPGSRIEVTCESGYQIAGHALLTCQQTSAGYRYVPEVPQCLPIRCNTLPVPRFGTISYPNNPVPGSVARYACDRGYVLNGPSELRCESNGMWSSNQGVTCRPISCGNQLPSIANAISGEPVDDTSYGKSYRLRCVNGFMPESITVVCAQNARWETVQSCMARPQCPNINVAGDVKITMEADHITIDFSCNPGYELLGNPRRTCLNGVWSPPLIGQNQPTCRRSNCEAPNVSKHGPLTYTRRGNGGPGTVYIFACRGGYRLEGSSEITCHSNGAYSGPIPRCTMSAQCGNQFGNPENGFVVYSDIDSHKRRADFTCSRGFRLDGPAAYFCTDGVWVPRDSPRCLRIVGPTCQSDVSIANGQVRFEWISGGVRAFFTCNHNYRIAGQAPNIVDCNDANGQWIGIPRCEPVQVRGCGQLNIINGRVSYTSNGAIGSVATFICNNGFVLPGQISQAECQHPGTWVPVPPAVCILGAPPAAHPCSEFQVHRGDVRYAIGGRPVPANNGQVASSTIADVQCRDPSERVEPADSLNLRCFNGVWNKDTRNIRCVRTAPSRQCAGLSLPNGDVSYSANLDPSSVARFTCNSPYTLTGTSESTCRNGAWDPVPNPQCIHPPIGRTCGPVVFPRVTYTANGEHNSVASFFCNNQVLVTSTCINGVWTPSPPVACPHVPEPSACSRNLRVLYGIVTYNDQSTEAFVTCDSGFRLQGPSNIYCRARQWSPLPSCQPGPVGPRGCLELTLVAGGTVIYSSDERSVGSQLLIRCTSGLTVYATCTPLGWVPDIANSPLSCTLGRIGG